MRKVYYLRLLAVDKTLLPKYLPVFQPTVIPEH